MATSRVRSACAGTPLGMAPALARAIPTATLRVMPDQGHLIFLSYWEEIVKDLLERMG